MDAQDLVSIVIPVYNAEVYLQECLDSIVRQTYKKIEIIVINDGSTDDSKAIIDGYKNDLRILTCTLENGGVSKARNVGLGMAGGEWVAFVDADDFLDKDMISNLYQAAVEASADVVIGEYIKVLGNRRNREKFLTTQGVKIITESEKNDLMKSCIVGKAYGNGNIATNIGVPWGKLYKKQMLDENKISFSCELTHMEDSLFNLNVFLNACRIVYLPSAGYFYRIHNESAVRKYNKDFEIAARAALNAFIQFSVTNHRQDVFHDVIEYKRFQLFHESIRKQYFSAKSPLTAKEKIREMERICNSGLDGSYNPRIRTWYAGHEIVYGLLVSFQLYRLLYYLLKMIKRR